MSQPFHPSSAHVHADENLVTVLRRYAETRPDQVIYTFLPSGGGSPEEITYGRLDERARQIATWLRAGPISPRQPVVLLFRPGLDYIHAFFGCLYAGHLPVPAYLPTHARHLTRLEAIVEDATAGFVLTGSHELETITRLAPQSRVAAICEWRILDESRSYRSDWVDPLLNAADVAFIQYTSGSTSAPRGVMVAHGNVLANVRSCAWVSETNAQTVMVHWLPPYHDFGLIGGILHPLVVGCHCVFMSPSSFLVNPLRWLRAISDYRGTVIGGPNFAFDLCARSINATQRASLDLSTVRVVFNGAEPVRQRTLERFNRAFAVSGFQPKAWYPAYGLAESTLMVSGRWAASHGRSPSSLSVCQSSLRKDRVVPLGETAANEDAIILVNHGRALPDHTVAIVNPDTRCACPEDQVGEIWVSGPSVAQGYWGRPGEYAATFAASIADVPPKQAREEHYLRTGDLGFLHDGDLYVCGRAKDLIIINGQNIYPQDVELVSSTSHPAVRENGAAAFAVAEENAERLVVVQELDTGQKADEGIEAAIAAAITDTLGLPPDEIILLKAGRIPRTSSGKVQRRRCRQELLEGKLPIVRRWSRPLASAMAPDRDRGVVDTEPQTPSPFRAADVETYLRTAMARWLDVDPKSIDTGQLFVVYGFDSIIATQVARDLGDWLQRPVATTVFLDHPSISQLARHLSQNTMLRQNASESDREPGRPLMP